MHSKPAALSHRDWLWLLAIWTIVAVTLVLRTTVFNTSGLFFVDTDDAMRMVVVKDFLAGQGWYDFIQHRLNTPYGAEIHWSRLVDLPLAGLMALFGMFGGPDAALTLAGTVWPLLLLAVLLWLSVRITLELVGEEALLPALVLPILATAILAEFTPGRVDHHNVIVVLTLACLLLSLLALRRPLFAWLAGIAAATALAVAVEALPSAGATILAFGLAYVADPTRAANLRRFGLGFAGATLVHLALARPPAQWLLAACDAISPVYGLAALAVGAVYLAVAVLPAPREAWQRLLLLAVMGMGAIALVVLVYPQCLGGPYADLDPWLADNWIAGIVEAKPWHRSLPEIPAYAISVAAPVLIGIVVGLFALRALPEKRVEWLILLVFILCTALIMLAQIRGARLAVLPTIPAAGWLIVEARKAYLARPRPWQILGLIGAWLAPSGVVLVLLVNGALSLLPHGAAQAATEAQTFRQACLAPGGFADLRALPPERIMAPVDMGAHILLETPHAVVGAPYHRNEKGLLDTFDFFNQPAEKARAIATERGLGLVVTCAGMPEMHGSGLATPGTILNLMDQGTLPDWLADVSLEGPLKVYAILP